MNRRFWLIITLVLMFSLSACQAARQTASEEVAPQEPAAGNAYEYGAPMEQPMATAVMDFDKGGRASQPEGAAGAQQVDRMVIRNADMAIIVDDPNVAMDTIIDMASQMGGFVVYSNIYQTYSDRGEQVPEGSITFRVPAERLDEAMDRIVALTTNPDEDVLRSNISGQDVTQEYTDLSSRLRNLEDAEEQLRKILDEAYQTEDVLSVFNQLTSIREQIEVIKGQMQYYEQAAALSSISVNIQARAKVAPITVAGWTPVGVARDAVQALVEAGQFLASAGIWLVLFLLPVLLLIALPVYLVFLLVRRVRGRRPPRPAATTD